MWREGRLKPADFCEKSPVFSQKHGGFLWKVGDLNRSDVEAAVIGDGRKAKKPNCPPLEVAVCGVNGGWGSEVGVFLRSCRRASAVPWGLSFEAGASDHEGCGRWEFCGRWCGETSECRAEKRQSPRGDCRAGKSVAPVRRAMCGGWIYFVSKTGVMRLRST